MSIRVVRYTVRRLCRRGSVTGGLFRGTVDWGGLFTGNLYSGLNSQEQVVLHAGFYKEWQAQSHKQTALPVSAVQHTEVILIQYTDVDNINKKITITLL